MKQFITLLNSLCIATIAFGQANTKLSNLVSPTAVNQHLSPSSNNTKDLGYTTYSWRNLYLRGDVYLDGIRFVSNGPATGYSNTFLGFSSGKAITKGSYNTALGYNALNKDTTGSYNTAVGTFALVGNTSGAYNIGIGAYALSGNTTGSYNNAIGMEALTNNTSGGYNLALGSKALYSNTIGGYNTAIGHEALTKNNQGLNNTAVGYQALLNNVDAQGNTAVGAKALLNNTTGIDNTATGPSALFSNTTGSNNTAIGSGALGSNTTGSINTAIGNYALGKNTISSGNVGIGYEALYSNITGQENTALGSYAGVTASSISNAVAIGYGARVDATDKVRIGNTTIKSIGGQVNWTAFSDGRYKQNIKQDVHGLDFINSLNPVTYTVDIKGLNAYYNKGRTNDKRAVDEKGMAEQQKSEASASKMVYNGFIAQDVEAAAKKLNYEFSGVDKPQSKEGLYGLRYSDFVVPLVKAVQELDSAAKAKDNRITELENRLSKLEASLVNSSNNNASTFAYLEQNNPNPVSGTTVIRYLIPITATDAKLSITNAKGQVIKTIAITNKGVGKIDFNTNMLAAGAYNYSLWVDGKQAAVKRMIIAR